MIFATCHGSTAAHALKSEHTQGRLRVRLASYFIHVYYFDSDVGTDELIVNLMAELDYDEGVRTTFRWAFVFLRI